MAVYYITFVASKIHICLQELMFLEQIYTVDTMNATWTSESGKHSGSQKLLCYSIHVYIFIPTKQMYIYISLC